MKALKSIRLSKFIWLAIRCRAFSFFLILQILLVCSSNFSSASKVIPSNFSLRLDAIDVLSERISICVFELKITWLLFPGSLHMIILTPIENFVSNSLKLKNYRRYILCAGIGSSLISVASNVTILTFKKQANQINNKQ